MNKTKINIEEENITGDSLNLPVYINISNKKIINTRVLEEGKVYVDYDSAGKIVGIEII